MDDIDDRDLKPHNVLDLVPAILFTWALVKMPPWALRVALALVPRGYRPSARA